MKKTGTTAALTSRAGRGTTWHLVDTRSRLAD